MRPQALDPAPLGGARIAAGAHGSLLARNSCGGTYRQPTHDPKEEKPMWKKPEYSELRYGFEITMYICNR